MKLSKSMIFLSIFVVGVIGVITEKLTEVKVSEEAGIEMFNNPNKLANELSQKTDLKAVSYFKDYGDGTFQGGSQQLEFGTENTEIGTKGYGFHNTLAIYINSTDKNYVQRLKVILNIFNPDERELALNNYKAVVSNVLMVTKLEEPKGLLNAVLNGEDFTFESKYYTITSKKKQEKGFIESQEFTIIDKVKSPK